MLSLGMSYVLSWLCTYFHHSQLFAVGIIHHHMVLHHFNRWYHLITPMCACLPCDIEAGVLPDSEVLN